MSERFMMQARITGSCLERWTQLVIALSVAILFVFLDLDLRRADGRGVDRLDLQTLDVLIAGSGGNDQNSGTTRCSRITVIR
jgi:hypothetical protein